jgi:hypothetical protein
MDSREEIKELIKNRFLHDPHTHIVVRVMLDMYLKDIEKESVNPIEKILNEHFDEFILMLFKTHFKRYDEMQELFLKEIQNKVASRIIITTQENYDKIKEKHDGCNVL